ncbi:DUF2235 domain-containing protein [Marinicella litoralis]|uniref:Uncharacterized protein (DUF2235 family) n=1 Tax=Marinicella litoralis TaxID=644220 RepID=A0A4R6XYZ7_9GAMM|nr:DUF2235 domain-containing protein [Marinicella litoralis]TDR23487.1 uncharacterized protein (DUF2235 family) [Marinicella litoralis]
MPKNIIICCDGTGNEIKENLSNVLKLFRVLNKNQSQVVYYDPGIGTISNSSAWARLKNHAKGIFGLATGYGLDDNVLDAYKFLMRHYKQGDKIFLFGFSRGAYSVRVLAGFLNLVGLLDPAKENLCGYALTAYKQSSENNDLAIGWRFQNILETRRVTIHFMGVWDTVASIIIPRPDRFYIPSFQALPYTKTNPAVRTFRQAMAIDEKRRMFRLYPWQADQKFKPNPFIKDKNAEAQDSKQVWFAGVHSDIGGGYPEADSGLAKIPLQWMIDEAVEQGLQIKAVIYKRLVLGQNPANSLKTYVAPNPEAKQHDSMNAVWKILEWLPKSDFAKEWPSRPSKFGMYLPLGEPRFINEDATIHPSVKTRQSGTELDPPYRPVNLSAE